KGNCNKRNSIMVNSCICVVRTIGFLVHARHSSQPSRCFRSRNPSSCRKRAQKISSSCSPVRSRALLTSVKRFLYPSTSATTTFTLVCGPATRHRHTTSFQRTLRQRPYSHARPSRQGPGQRPPQRGGGSRLPHFGLG